MAKRRQRNLRGLASAPSVLVVLVVLCACSTVPNPDLANMAATAIVAAPTAAAQAQGAVAAAQTALPGAQATVQAGATVASGVLGSPQLVSHAVSLLLAGASVSLATTPPNSTGDAVQHLTVTAVDSSGAFGRLDSATQRQAANGALLAAAQAFPKATIALSITDAAGAALLTGSKAPGGDPSIAQ